MNSTDSSTASVIRGVLSIAVPVLAALALFVFAFIAGSLGRLVSTLVTTVIAISVVAGIWLVSNFVLTQARNRWPLYMALSFGIAGAVSFGLLRGNEVVTALFVNEDPLVLASGRSINATPGSGFLGHIEWSIVGALIWGGGAALLTGLPNRMTRLPIGLAMGALTGWLIAGHTLIWQRPALSWGSTIAFTVVGAAVGAALSAYYSGKSQGMDPVPGALLGAAAGWTIAVWLRSAFEASFDAPYIATMLPLMLIGARVAWKDQPNSSKISRMEERGRALIFLGPAMLFLSAALVIPAIATVRLSFLDRDAEEGVGLQNYRTLFSDEDAFNVSNWTDIFGSSLFWIAIVLILAGTLIGTFIGTTRNGHAAFDRSGASIGSISVGLFIFLTAVFAVLRGTFFNNLWWIVTVTVMSVVLGLTVAVLAERAGRFESVAKSLIFMPLAVSFVGASIIWRLQYQARPTQKSQTGLLNWTWIKLGELSHSGAPRIVVLLVLLALIARLGVNLVARFRRDDSFTAPVVGIIILGYLGYQLLIRSLGGFRVTSDGSIGPETILFLENRPFNNVFLMIVLIWIQTGFAMVILAAAIKSVPSEYIEAAKVDGATDSQTFFNITLPTILPTVGVITTTLIVLVTKVFDIVKVTTNGNFGSNVLANDFFTVRFSFFDNGLGSAIATVILLMVLPVMITNVRRMQKARTA